MTAVLLPPSFSPHHLQQPIRPHPRTMSAVSISPSPSLPGLKPGRNSPALQQPSGLSRLAFAQSATPGSRLALPLTRDSSSSYARPQPPPANLQSFFEGVEFATRCNIERRGESRAGSRAPSHIGFQRIDSTLETRTKFTEEEDFLSDYDDGDETFAPGDASGDATITEDGLQVFEEGDRLTVGHYHDGSRVEECMTGQRPPDADTPRDLEIVRRLGNGSYAVVYLARSIVPPTYDDDVLDDARPLQYGKEYALKCLCKKNLTDDLLEVQRYEATLHQSLPNHPNIVRMHGAFETDKWLFLVLEYCPGQDLFYWLEQARDHEQLDTLMHPSASFNTARAQQRRLAEEYGPDSHSATPPSPTLLSITAMSSLLSRRRLRLISRMFMQMCDAVDVCHRNSISHRDIKPENFICCDDDALSSGLERRVTVKITDWGLGTAETECGDFDCGSKPYMAYECRNNLAPTYRPREADVWSLGIVLLNLLFHRCPWADPSLDDPDFAEYRRNPNHFLNDRFKGIGPEVSHFLATRVLNCYGPRVSAGEFGKWASGLVRMMSQDPTSSISTSPRNVNVSDAAVPLVAARVPDSRRLNDLLSQTSTRQHSRRTSNLSERFDLESSRRNSRELMPLPALADAIKTLPDAIPAPFDPAAGDNVADADAEGPGSDAAILAANAKRRTRKRGARKGRTTARPDAEPDAPATNPAADLAQASQKLARELSRQSSTPRSMGKPKSSTGLVSKFKNLKNGNPDLEAFIARAKEKEALRDSGGATNSAPGRIQQINSFGSARSFGSTWSTDEESRSHWASTSSRRERLAREKPLSSPVSPVTSSSSTSSPSSRYSESSFTSAVSSVYKPPATRSTKADMDPTSATPLRPIHEQPPAPSLKAAPAKESDHKFTLRKLFR